MDKCIKKSEVVQGARKQTLKKNVKRNLYKKKDICNYLTFHISHFSVFRIYNFPCLAWFGL